MSKVALISSKSDAGGNVEGSAQAPDAVKELLGQENLFFYDIPIMSLPIYLDIHQNYKNDMENYKNFEEFVYYNQKIFEQFSKRLHENKIPVLLGGDHSLAIGSILAAQKYSQEKNKELIVLWFDAHTDCHTLQSSESKNTHGMPVSFILGDGFNFLQSASFLNVKNLYQIGIRSVDEMEKVYVNQKEMNIFSSSLIQQKGIKDVYLQLIQKIENYLKEKKISWEDVHLHISFDVDCIDPIQAPGVGTPVENGMTLEDIHFMIHQLNKIKTVNSLDIVELNPQYDKTNQTVKNTVAIIR